MSDPVYTCLLCGNHQVVNPGGRDDFPPAAAKVKLYKRCRHSGCPCEPQYTAGSR